MDIEELQEFLTAKIQLLGEPEWRERVSTVIVFRIAPDILNLIHQEVATARLKAQRDDD